MVSDKDFKRAIELLETIGKNNKTHADGTTGYSLTFHSQRPLDSENEG
jgi:hypothetical protein